MKTLKLQIKKRLTDDSTYVGLMGTPTAEPYQTYWFKPPVAPTFPETVLNITGVNDTSAGKDFLPGRFTLSLNVWSKDDTYEDIVKRIIQLLHQSPETGTTGFRAIYTGEPEDMYDDEFAVYGKRVVFDVFYRRATI